MEKFKNKFKKESPRLKNRDHGATGFYSVTICTLNRKNYFGVVAHVAAQNVVETENVASLHDNASEDFSIQLTHIGKIAHQNWMDIPNHFQFVSDLEFAWQPRFHERIIRN